MTQDKVYDFLKRFFLEVAVPPGATALVGVPCAETSALWESGRVVAEDYRHQRRAYVQVASGRYSFNCTLGAW